MDHFSNIDQASASATVTAPAHVCEELLKLHGIDFHDNPLVTEMSKKMILIIQKKGLRKSKLSHLIN